MNGIQQMKDELLAQRALLGGLTNQDLCQRYARVTEQEWRAMPAGNLVAWQDELTDRGLVAQLERDLQLHTLPHWRVLQKRGAEGTDEALVALRETWNQAKAQLLPIAKVLGLSSEPVDRADRLFFTRLANDSRHPMTAETVEALMRMSHEDRVARVELWVEDREGSGWPVSPSTEEWLQNPLSVETGRVAGGLPKATESPTPSEAPTGGSPRSRASTMSGDLQTGPPIVAAAEPGRVIAQPSSGASSGAATPVENGLQTEVYLRLPLNAKRDAFVHDGFLYVRRSVLQDWWSHLNSGKCCTQQRSGLSGHSSSCWIYQDAVR